MITILALLVGMVLGYALGARQSIVAAFAALKQRFVNWLHHGDSTGGGAA